MFLLDMNIVSDVLPTECLCQAGCCPKLGFEHIKRCCNRLDTHIVATSMCENIAAMHR